MHIVIVGPGALGSLLAARIARFIEQQGASGPDYDIPQLLLLDHRAERVSQIRENGLLLEEKGQRASYAVRIEADPKSCAGGDVLFLCVKSMAVPQALAGISPYVSRNALLVAMQNGIGHLDAVRAFPCPGALGVTSEGATLVGPGHVRHGGAGTTRLGLLDPERRGAGPLEETAGLLNGAGLQTVVTNNPLKHLWAKLFINVAINGLTAIHRCPNGELLHSQATKDIMEKAVREAVKVAGALAIPVDGDPVASAFRVCESTANNISSMHQDVLNRRQTEIDAINGAVVQLGKRLGIPTPVNENLVLQVKRIEASYLQ